MTRSAPPVSLDIEEHPSPNHNERRAAVDILLLHYTGMADCAAAIDRLCDPASDVSSHYVVRENGAILRLVDEERRAWHAGHGNWQGRGDINSRSIGIEICNGGHEFGLPPYPRRQMAAVMALCRDILSRWLIPPRNVLAHSDTAPQRKVDPGERFSWARLAAAGIGHWVRPSRARAGMALRPGMGGEAVEALQNELAAYGYGITASGRYDEQTEIVVRAFQRHFRPSRCDGIADAATRSTLRQLLATLAPAG